MFFRLFALFAVLAVAFAAPKPEPQFAFTGYAAPYTYPYAGAAALGYSTGYNAFPYTGYSGYYVR